MKRKRRAVSNWQIVQNFALQAARWGMIAGGVLGALYPVVYTMEMRGLFFSAVGFFYGAILGVPIGLTVGAMMGAFIVLLITLNASSVYAEFVLDLGLIGIMVFSGMMFYSLFDGGSVVLHLMVPTGIASSAALFAIKRTMHGVLDDGEMPETADIES